MILNLEYTISSYDTQKPPQQTHNTIYIHLVWRERPDSSVVFFSHDNIVTSTQMANCVSQKYVYYMIFNRTNLHILKAFLWRISGLECKFIHILIIKCNHGIIIILILWKLH